MNLNLEIAPPSGEPISRTISDGILIIGSAATCDIVLDGIGVQAEQARMEVNGDRILIFNLGALNLVQVGGRPVSSTVLDLEEPIEIANWTLRLRSSATNNQSARERRHLLDQLARRINLREVEIENLAEPELWEICGRILDELLGDIKPAGHRDTLRREVLNEALGLGPLQDLLVDESITEIMANGPSNLFVERAGRISPTHHSFASETHMVHTIQRMIWPLGRRVDESSPIVDARLPDGSRVNVVLPPVALGGPQLTIRKFFKTRYTLEDLVRLGSVLPEWVEMLDAMVQNRSNILISGGASTGKTTLLNALAARIPKDERVVTIEDAAELQLSLPNLCAMEARPPNIEGRGEIPIRDLVRNALRMRPDRIIVGECRGAEALDMLQAMNSGNDGSLATLHANSPEDTLLRLEMMIMMGTVELPGSLVRRQIASGINSIIHLARQPSGQRGISKIVEVLGLHNGEFHFKTHGDRNSSPPVTRSVVAEQKLAFA